MDIHLTIKNSTSDCDHSDADHSDSDSGCSDGNAVRIDVNQNKKKYSTRCDRDEVQNTYQHNCEKCN